MNKEFEEIYRLYVGDVYRFLLKLSGDENVVEGCAGIGKEKEDAVAENSYMVR